MYAIRDNIVYNAKIIKLTKRGTGAFCTLTDIQSGKVVYKSVIVSAIKLFDTYDKAKKELKRKEAKKKQEEIKLKQLREESEKVSNIMYKILNEFEIKIPCLSQPATVKEAKQIYNEIKSQKMMRNSCKN